MSFGNSLTTFNAATGGSACTLFNERVTFVLTVSSPFAPTDFSVTTVAVSVVTTEPLSLITICACVVSTSTVCSIVSPSFVVAWPTSLSPEISTTELSLSIEMTRFSEATLILTFLPADTFFFDTKIFSDEPLVESCVTDESLATNTTAGSGKFSSNSSPSVCTVYSVKGGAPHAMFELALIDRALMPSTIVPEAGLYVPLLVVIDQFRVFERITSSEFLTVDCPSPNGTVAVTRVLMAVKSRSPDLPRQMHGSLFGSLPENENSHVWVFKSTLMNRFWPGQFESSTRMITVSASGNSMA